MLNFSKNESDEEISSHIAKIRKLSEKVEQKITQKGKDNVDNFIETLSVEELKDLRQVILAAEYLLAKYQDKRDLKIFLEDFIGIIMHAANSVNSLKDELEDLVISAEVALQHIQSLHSEVTYNLTLGKGIQTKLDDFKAHLYLPPAKTESIPDGAKAGPSSINLTNPSSRVHTSDYLERTPVEI